MNKTGAIAIAVLTFLVILPSTTPALASPQVSPAACCVLKGKWNDVFGFLWNLPCPHHSCGTAKKGYTITGTVNMGTIGGGIASVSGRGQGDSFTMTATGGPGCFSTLTYTSTMFIKSGGAGTWTDACGNSGIFSIEKGWP